MTTLDPNWLSVELAAVDKEIATWSKAMRAALDDALKAIEQSQNKPVRPRIQKV